ncbi:hypothetical protein [Tengunoibacter tsumagoiensis]|uniref:hypothetical protein n=1 Tax=Tengunoibacter tsumagoiensis TaxID=2014871 RepID=UPI001386D704|nr:hypothetical protein [Tengunoibacter tsumagoiensis]
MPFSLPPALEVVVSLMLAGLLTLTVTGTGHLSGSSGGSIQSNAAMAALTAWIS